MFETPQPPCFVDDRKTEAHIAVILFLIADLFDNLTNFKLRDRSDQVTRSGQLTPPKKVLDSPTATVFKVKLRNI